MTAPPPLLAFQVWDAVGWAGQALFAGRFLHQWISSERARRSHVTPAFWSMSLAATLLLVVYTLYRRDPVFVAGFLVNLFLYARNLMLFGAGPGADRARSPLAPLLVGLGVFGGLTVLSLAAERAWLDYDAPAAWLALGFAGQALWSSRFLVQWFVSERRGRSVLPASFFWMSLAGVPFLLAWAVYRVDWVMMAAFALNPVPYVRNLILLRRQRKGDG